VPSSPFTVKKPSPEIAISSVLSVVSIVPWVNCWVMPCTRTPWPATWWVVCIGAAAKMSPNWALLFLKAVEFTLATLFETADRSACAPLRPESET
jgi:hypothetical protein